MYWYKSYGLAIRSETELPELGAAEPDGDRPVQVDVTIRFDRIDLASPGMQAKGGKWYAVGTGMCVCYDGLGSFLIRGGTEIIVDPAPNSNDQTLRLFLLGPALAILLHQRGHLVLHASAVEIDGVGVVFMGAPGSGKSTTATAFHRRGHPLVADDIVSVSFDRAGSALIDVAPPLVKIWPDAATALGEDLERAPRVSLQIDKRLMSLQRPGSPACIPLGRIFILAEDECEQAVPLNSQEAFVELVRHTFVVHLLSETQSVPAHFRQCSAVAGSVPARRLNRRMSLDSLDFVIELVKHDLTTLGH